MSDDRGRFTWFELLTTDPDAAIDFYTGIVGWGRTSWEGAIHYDMFTQGETPIAGVMGLPEEARAGGAPPHWLGYVYTADVAATKAQAAELGGSVLAEVTVPQVGTMAVLCDPQGGVIAAFQPDNEPSLDHQPAIGEVSWTELATTDYAAAFDFYQQLFGWELMQDMDMGEAGIYRMFGRGGRMLGGIWNKPAEMPVGWLYYVRVADLDAATAAINARGGKVLNGPMEVPGGSRIVQALDPQGAAFALHEDNTGA